MLIPPEPRLDLPFLSVLFLGFVLVFLSSILLRKVKRYEKEIDTLRNLLHSFDHNAIKPDNSNTRTKSPPSQL